MSELTAKEPVDTFLHTSIVHNTNIYRLAFPGNNISLHVGSALWLKVRAF